MKSRAASAKDGGKAEGRTHGRLAREGREGGRRRNRGRRPGQGLGERGETSNGAPAADTRNTRGLSHRRAPTPARRRSPQNVFPEDDGAERAPRRTSARPDRTPTGRRTTAKSLFPSQGPTRAVPSRTHRPPKNTPRRPRSPRSRGDLQLLTRLPSGSRTAADARARACPAIPPNGGPAARPGRPTGENRRQAGRGNGTAEREPAAAGATGTAPGRRPTRDRERPPIRATTGQRELTDGNHTAPRLLLRQSRRQTSGAKPARNRRRPPGKPGKTQHERLPTPPPPPKTPEREVGPRHTSSDTPGTTDRRSPKAASEREVSQSRHTRNTLAPWRGRSPMIPKRGNAAAWRRTRRPSIDGTSTSDTHAWTRSGMSAPRERR